MKRRNNNMICIDKEVAVCEDSEEELEQVVFEDSVDSEVLEEALK